MKRLGGIASLLSAGAFIIGLWFFFTERNFAQEHDNALARNLQWIGVALALLGVAGFLIGLILGYSKDD